MADVSTSGVLSAAWDGVTPATAPAGSVVGPIQVGRDSTVGIDVRGTFTATVTLELSIDGSNWYAATATTTAGAGSTNTFTAPGDKLVSTSGASLIRARCSAYTSGSATVVMAGTPGGAGGGGGGASGAVTIADGADVAEGSTADAGIITDTSGTLVGFARGNILQWITGLARFGTLTEAAPATDTASSGLNGRLQRVAQRITSLIALLPSALVGGRLDVNVGATVTPANVALDATVGTTNTEIGGLTETAPGTDTASSGLNGRLQRIAQRLTSLIALLPSALISNRLDVNLGAAPATVTTNSTLQAGTATAGNTGGMTAVINATLTRPANTTAYTAGDEMTDTGGAILTLTSAALRSGGGGVINQITMSCSSNAATKPQLECWLFDTTSTPQTDNAAFAPSDAVVDTHLTVIPLTASYIGDATANTGNFIMDTGQIAVPFVTSGSANLFMRIVVRNAYTAGANSDTHKFRVHISQDA